MREVRADGRREHCAYLFRFVDFCRRGDCGQRNSKFSINAIDASKLKTKPMRFQKQNWNRCHDNFIYSNSITWLNYLIPDDNSRLHSHPFHLIFWPERKLTRRPGERIRRVPATRPATTTMPPVTGRGGRRPRGTSSQ
ncbi:hypothetical protein [Burkholderia lata]|uniref:hypothetical protein n=1 Tax=Burkholderia lata (strain ATCC 17760 / DSM 23089 / LMG 22485 / NCIMB 9086 / R18194 / 383) TaxID=482957 RepID=UPI00158286D2|nr:hypothetical protein [Burkholderia lata]